MESVETSESPLIEVRGLSKWYSTNQSLISEIFGKKEYLKAVDDVSFDIQRGEILGLAGQSGCGKSTLGELLVRLQEPTSGEIRYDGADVTNFGSSRLKQFRRNCQIIFQDPYESINPRFPVSRIVKEPLDIHSIGDRSERKERAIRALEDAGLKPAEKYLGAFPDELSGGERQRVSIARAIVLEPDFLVADEPVSMLDVSVRSGILKLFDEFREEKDMSIVYVSHDLSTINHLCDRTMIMYLGNVVELGDTRQVIHHSSHPYTKSLVNSVPDPNTYSIAEVGDVDGDVPDPIGLPQGCRYQPRCQYAEDKCAESEPELTERDDANVPEGTQVACYYPVDS